MKSRKQPERNREEDHDGDILDGIHNVIPLVAVAWVIVYSVYKLFA